MHLTLAIATWNRAALLAETLASLALLRVPEGVTWEVLVCDNNSTDNTKQTVQNLDALAGRLKPPSLREVRYLFEPTQGKSHALNRLLREATGDWVLLLDDDVEVDPDWMAAMVRAMARYPKAAVFGGAVLPNIKRPLPRGKAFLLEHFPGPYGVTRVERDTPITGTGLNPGGANMAVKREVALQVGYDTQRGMFPGRRIAGEDVSMALGIIERGHEGWMIADAKVLHHTPEEIITRKRLYQWQMGIGRVWAMERGKPTPGKFGVAWWAWKEMLKRWGRQMVRWRPWPTKAYFDALVASAQYWGYLRAK